MVRVGIFGLGKMGSAFATNLLSKRNEVHVYNRNKERLRGLVSKGAIAHPTPVELAKSVDVVITSLTDQDVVDSVLKDLTLVENQATRHKAALPLGSLVRQFFTASVNQGQGEMDFSSSVLTLQKLNGVELLAAVPS